MDWRSYFPLISLWVRILFSVILEGGSQFRKLLKDRAQVKASKLRKGFWIFVLEVPGSVPCTPPFAPCWLPHFTYVTDQKEQNAFPAGKRESNRAKLLSGFIGDFQTIAENSLRLGVLHFSRKGSLRLTLWQPWATVLLLAGEWRCHQTCHTFQIGFICQAIMEIVEFTTYRSSCNWSYRIDIPSKKKSSVVKYI